MEEAIRIAVTTRLLQNWSGDLNLVDVGANHKFEEPVDSAWIRLTIVPYLSENAEVGAHMQRTYGEIIVQCFVPLYSGEQDINLMCDEIRTIFQNQNFDGMRCLATSTIKIGASGGNWYQQNASTRFEFDDFS